MHESARPPPLLPIWFEDWADDVLNRDINLARENIHASSVRDVYMYLTHQQPPSFLTFNSDSSDDD